MHPNLAEYGPVRFHGDPNALYDRHLVFEYAIDPGLGDTEGKIRGSCALPPGRARLAMAAYKEDPLRGESQARLLSFHGVPDRPVAGQ